MKRGNNSILAIGIIFFFLMVFVLFKPGMQSDGTQIHLLKDNIFTGNFAFDVSNINTSTEVSKNIEGTLNFTITKEDVNNSVINITSLSYFRIILAKNVSENPFAFDKEFTLESMKDSTIPKIDFVSGTGDKAFNISNFTSDQIIYTIPLSFFAINYGVGGNYTLYFDLRYNSSSSKGSFYKQVDVFINDANVVPVSTRAPKLKKPVPNIDLRREFTYNLSIRDYFEFDEESNNTEVNIFGEYQADIELDGEEGIYYFTASEGMKGRDRIYFVASDQFGNTSSNNFTIFYGSINASGAVNQSLNITPVCVPDWKCDDWTKCAGVQRTRECSDANSCNTTEGKPPVSQKCTVLEDKSQSEQTDVDSEETIQRVKLQKLKTVDGETTVAGLSIPIFIGIAVLLCVVLGGGAFYYFKFVRKEGEDASEDKTTVKNNPISTGGITGVSTIDKVAVQQVKPQIKQEPVQQIKPANIDEIYKYLETATKAGLDIEKAKGNLINTGWNKNDVERAGNVIILKKYAAEKIEKGFDKQQLRDSLAAKGWKQDLLDEVFVK